MEPDVPMPAQRSWSDRSRAVVDFLLGVFLFAWLYGVPFLLTVGLIRRTSSVSVSTIEQAEQVGTVTDRYLIWGLLLNVAIPALGLLLAAATRQQPWLRRYGWAVLAAVGVYLLMGMASSAATDPLIGHRPASLETPPPAPTHCIPISGGRGCPGG
jgi:hypothetical protein